MRIRQVALVARELEPVVEDLRAVLGLEVAYRDPGVATFGLQNAVLPVGDSFLEVVSPAEPGTTAARLLEKRGGDGGYMVIVQTTDMADAQRRIETLGARVVWSIDLGDATAIHLHPRDVGCAILSLDEMRPEESWRWAGPDWRSAVRSERVQTITGVELQCTDPEQTAKRWAGVLGAASVGAVANAVELRLESTRVRFVSPRDERGEGLVAVMLRAADPQPVIATARERGLGVTGSTIDLCGVRLCLE
jgi:catechol 2,3-dioxygenase-like lactoylglutathione lyase family enzyme